MGGSDRWSEEGGRKARPQVELERGWHLKIAGVSHRVAGGYSSLQVVTVKTVTLDFTKTDIRIKTEIER